MNAAEFGVDVARGDDGVAWLVLRNPTRRNAVRLEMWEAIPRAVEEAVADPNVRVLVLRGHGEEAFTAGADISEFTTRRGDAARDLLDRRVDRHEGPAVRRVGDRRHQGARRDDARIIWFLINRYF